MKIAVVGSRGISMEYDLFCELLDSLIPDETTAIVSGGAKGVDSLAARFAKSKGLSLEEFLPDYSTFGKIAPLVRNRTIIDNSDFVLAIWDGKSKGTLNSVDYTLEQGKPLAVYYLQQDEVRFFKPKEDKHEN